MASQNSLVKREPRVALTYASQEDAALKTVGELKGSGHKAYKMMSENPESIESTLTSVHSEMGGLHVLVNNAGITKDQLLLRMKTKTGIRFLKPTCGASFLAQNGRKTYDQGPRRFYSQHN